MKVASYIGTQHGYAGLGNRLIRWRYGGSFLRDGEASHTELVFEPGDGVDHLMPDGTTETVDGTVWCASASGLDKMPWWSKYRAGRTGGVRFKRVALNSIKWELRPYYRNPIAAAQWFKDHEGQAYNWGQILVFLEWIFMLLFKNSGKRWTCTCTVAAAGGYGRPDFYHPELMRSIVG